MKKIVCDMEDVKYVLKQILTSAGVYLAKLKNRMLGFLRHQITIWIIMKEKQNIMIIVTSYVKNVVKKLISIIPVEIVIVIERKLIVMKEIVCDMEDVKDVLKQILTSAGVHLAKSKDQMLGFLR